MDPTKDFPSRCAGGCGEEFEFDRDVVRRIRRLETRATNALRYVGLVPGLDVPKPLASRVLYDQARGELVVTGVDVPLWQIADAAVRSGHPGDLPIVVNNHLWGVIHVQQRERSTTV